MFSLFGVDCDDEEDQKICKETRDVKSAVLRLNENSAKKLDVKTRNARAECSAYFKVQFGWEDADKFGSEFEKSPMDESFAGLKLRFGETSYSNTYVVQSIGKVSDGLSPDNKRGNVWIIEFEAPAPSTTGDTQFFVEIEHDILDTEFNFWVTVEIEFSFT